MADVSPNGRGDSYTLGPVDRNQQDAIALRKAIDDYLQSLHSTTWGDTYTVTKADTRAKAVEFIARTFEGVARVARDEGAQRWTHGGYTFTYVGKGDVKVYRGSDDKLMDTLELDAGLPMTPERLQWIGREWLAMLADAMVELGHN